jgi:hypothetical protein
MGKAQGDKTGGEAFSMLGETAAKYFIRGRFDEIYWTFQAFAICSVA